MGPAGAELGNGLVRGAAHAGGLGRNGHLVIQDAQHRGLQHLRLDHGRDHRDDGLRGEDDLALAHSVHRSGELHGTQVLAEFLIAISREELLVEFLRLGAQFLDHLDDLFRAAHDGPVVVLRRLPVKEVEGGDFLVLPAFQVRLSHRVLVLVGAIGSVQFVHDIWC